VTLSRDALLKAGVKRKEIPLPELGGSVFVRELTAGQVVEFSKRQKADPESAVYYLLIAGVTDCDGVPLFGEADVEAIKSLGSTTSGILVAAVLELSGMTETPDTKKKPDKN
jgi:predicted exporter